LTLNIFINPLFRKFSFIVHFSI